VSDASAAFRLTRLASSDYADILSWTRQRYGRAQAVAYKKLLDRVIEMVAADPNHIGSRARPQFGAGFRSIHAGLAASRRSAARHVVMYRTAPDDVVEIVRIFHDAMEISRHLPTGSTESPRHDREE
jgi:toxin ParE1/3/4